MKIIPKMIEGGEGKVFHTQAPKKKRFSSKEWFLHHSNFFFLLN